MSTPERSPIYAIGINYFFLFAAFAVVVPYLQLFLATKGFSPSDVGLLLGIFQVSGMVGPLIIGHIADRSGRFRTVRGASLSVAAAAFFVLNIVSGFLPAAALSMVAGFAFRSTVPLTDAHASNLLRRPEQEYGRARFVGSLGFIACSAVIQFTGHLADAGTDKIVATILVLLGAYLAVIVLMPSLRSARTGGEPGQSEASLGGFDTAFWLFVVTIFTAQVGMAAYNSFFSLYLEEEVGEGLVSGMWALGAAAETPIILFAGFFIRRFGIRLMLVGAFLSITARLLLYAYLPLVPVVAGAQLLHGLSFGLMHTAGISYISRRVPARKRGLGMAVYSSGAMAFSTFVGSAAGGFIIEAAGFPGLMTAYSVLPLAALAMLLGSSRRLALL